MGYVQPAVYPPSADCEIIHKGPVWSHVVNRKTGQDYAMLETEISAGQRQYGSNPGDLAPWSAHMQSKVYGDGSDDRSNEKSRKNLAATKRLKEVMQELEDLRESQKENWGKLSAVYNERAKCNQLIVAMSKALGAVGGVRAASLEESRKWPVVFARIPMIDPRTQAKLGEHEVSWHISADDMIVDIEQFGIVDLPWDGKDNTVTYERVEELTRFFLSVSTDGNDDNDNKNKPE